MELQGAASATFDESYTPQDADWQGRYLGIPGLRIAGGTD